MQLYTSSGDSGLFNLLGKLFGLARAVDAARTNTVWPKVQALQAVLDLAPEAQTALTAHTSWESSGGSLQSQIAACGQLLIRRYILEKNLPYRGLAEALEIIRQDLSAGGYYFTASTKSLSVTPDGGNQADILVAASDKNPYGEPVWIYPEAITISGTQERLLVSAPPPVTRGHRLWPQGSGTLFSMTVAKTGDSLLANPGFEETTAANTPAGWSIHTGTPGSTIFVTEPEEQQITISGNPTGGYFILTWLDPQNRLWQTKNLTFAPTASEIQNALREIPGLHAVTVSGSGPFTVTFEDTPGDINPLGVINKLTGGTNPQVTVTTTRQGDVLSYRGRSLKFVGTGSENTTIYQPLRLVPGRVYFLFARARRSATASGEIRLELRRSINESTLADSAGNLNRIAIAVSGLSTTGHTGISGSFRLPVDYGNNPCIFVITASTPINSGQSVGLDDLIIVEGSRLYAGGPYLAAAAGWKRTAADRWTITASNNLQGKWEVVLERFFRWRELLDRKVPDTGTTIIPDSLLD
jgi:hypothetical protein